MRVQATARACPQTLEGGNGRALKINERALGASASHDYMPKYKHAPIEEAMCEFMFAPSNMAGQWDLTLPGRVQQHPHLRVIHNGVSRQQHVQQIVAEQAAPNTVANIALATALLRVLIPTADGKAVLGIGQDSLSVSSLREYEGWEKFKPRIRIALDAYREVVQPTQILRITVKFINRIIAPKPHATTAAEYLGDIQPTPAQPRSKAPKKEIAATLTADHYRKEFASNDHVKIVVTQATLQPSAPSTSEFLLDIETVYDHAALTDIDEAMEKVERLHAVEGAIFGSLITEAARNLFNVKWCLSSFLAILHRLASISVLQPKN